ncbi:hypothetical protein ON010_g7247 [Phytophthora cinnamomi]|nr:hypothetical protein ON010_g7247 [Phytophthora cinnamomi]
MLSMPAHTECLCSSADADADQRRRPLCLVACVADDGDVRAPVLHNPTAQRPRSPHAGTGRPAWSSRPATRVFLPLA